MTSDDMQIKKEKKSIKKRIDFRNVAIYTRFMCDIRYGI